MSVPPESPSPLPILTDATGTACIRRGRQWLSSLDFQAHLAALLRLDNVGVLLGAGASMGAGLGGMTMAGIWKAFSSQYAASVTWLNDNGFTKDGDAVNVETLADALDVAALEWKRTTDSKLPDLEGVRANLNRSVIAAALLRRPWWEDPWQVGLDAPELNDHRALLQKLTSARQPGQPAPWLFTTNYDLAIEWAAESINLKVINGFDGLHHRVFSPHNFDLGWRNVLARGEARFGTYHVYLAKLHGSLSWHSHEDVAVESPAAARWPGFSEFLGGGKAPAGLLVLPSVTKYVQTVGFVLGELFRRFAEFLGRPQTALVVNGYSFSDEHLNRLLLTAVQNPTLHMVIYLPEIARTGDELDLTKCSRWVQRLVAVQSPQVTVVGGGNAAFFAALASDLPDPAVYDDQAAKVRKMLRNLSVKESSPQPDDEEAGE